MSGSLQPPPGRNIRRHPRRKALSIALEYDYFWGARKTHLSSSKFVDFLTGMFIEFCYNGSDQYLSPELESFGFLKENIIVLKGREEFFPTRANIVKYYHSS